MSTLAELLAKAQTTAATDKPEAMVWLNVGAPIPVDGKPTFISLPIGIPLDTMKEAKGTGSFSQAKNMLLASLMQMSETVAPGEGKTIAGLEIQLYRRGEKQEAQPAPVAFNLSFK